MKKLLFLYNTHAGKGLLKSRLDAVQDALLRAWSRRNLFRAGTNLEAWLYKLAYHACIDLLRQRRRQLFAPPPPSGHNPDYIGPELRAAPATAWSTSA